MKATYSSRCFLRNIYFNRRLYVCYNQTSRTTQSRLSGLEGNIQKEKKRTTSKDN